MFEKVKILATGRLLLGTPEVGLIGRNLSELMDSVRSELIVVAYRFTVASGDFRQAFERVLERGCRVILVLDSPINNKDEDPALKDYLKNMLVRFSELEVWDFLGTPVSGGGNYNGQLHAKVVVADRKKAVVGSANFSRNGLLENHELAVLVNGRPALSVAKSVDKMISEGRANGIIVQRQR